MRKQELDWGSINWIFEPEAGSGDIMRVGISTMYSHSVQPRHIHSGDEQFIYILSGHGRQKINDVEYRLEPGEAYHISAGMSHEAVNEEAGEIVKLLVSIPTTLDGTTASLQKTEEQVLCTELIDRRTFLKETVLKISEQMLDPLKLPLSIYDIDGALIYQNKEYPPFCKKCCKIGEDQNKCRLYQKKADMHSSGQSAFVCEYGLALYTRLVACGEIQLGSIRAGHVRISEPAVRDIPRGLPYNVPSSTVMGILQIMEKISDTIGNYYRINSIKTELTERRKALSESKERDRVLQMSLRSTQNRALNLQISQHFLFNTLNMILSTAIRENADDTYQAVSSLAMLMQYTLRNDHYFVSLREEISHMENYTKLQQMRFGQRLEVRYDIDDTLLSKDVPFNFLQPVAENCFKHGFQNREDVMTLSVSVYSKRDFLTFKIQDNGEGMSPKRLEHLREIARNGNAPHGTAMVMRKLEALYGDTCHYSVKADCRGTTVTIEIPDHDRSGERRLSDEKGAARG